MKTLAMMLCVMLFTAVATHAQTAAHLRLVPTLESCSVYVQQTQQAPDALNLAYRKTGSTAWLTAHELVNSDNDAVPRTSLFMLSPDTQYDVQLTDKNAKVLASATFKTWAQSQPIAKTIFLSAADFAEQGLHLDQSGTEDGWIKYVGDGVTTFDADNRSEAAIHVDKASYIILENIILKGGKRHGIHLDQSSHIIVRNCDISGYGRLGTQRIDLDGKYYDENNKSINWDSGIHIDRSQHILIEHNFIHDPRTTANSWFYSHPAGPNAIFLRALGQVVIRYNDLIGSNAHRWNDVIEAYGNGHFDGGFNKDADIYGNYFAFGNDDGIELDGGQCNVRFWGNKIEGTLCGISTAANVHGPSFIFRNLVTNLGDERGAVGSAVKNGGGTTYTHGISHFYHNTFFTNGHGIKAVGYGKDDNRSMFFGKSRNNLLALGSNGIDDPRAPTVNDFDYDLFATPMNTPGTYNLGRPMEAHDIIAPANLRAPANADFRPQSNSPTIHAGIPIPGITADSTKRPTIGCFEADGNAMSPMRDLPITVSQQQFILDVIDIERQPIAQHLTIHPATHASPISYTIQKNQAFDWLIVSPSQGTLSPKQEVTLTLSVDRTKLKDYGLIPGAFVIKLADGRSIPITTYAKHAAARFSHQVEATDCAGVKDFAIGLPGDEPIDPDGQGIWFRTVDGREVGDRKLSLELDIPSDGKYYVFLNVKCPNPGGLHDSAYLQINDEKPSQVAIKAGNYWHWVNLTGRDQSFQLKAGKNTITLYPREAIWLQSIRIDTQPMLVGE